MQILRYAEHPEFVETAGSQKTLSWAIDDEDFLRDAVASAYLGRPVAWHSLYSEGKESRSYVRAGQNVADIWQAHADLAEKVTITSDGLCMCAAPLQQVPLQVLRHKLISSGTAFCSLHGFGKSCETFVPHRQCPT